MKKSLLFWTAAILTLLVISYTAAILTNGPDTALAFRPPEIEDCLPIMLAGQIDRDYELETIKAQAIIARTNLYGRYQNTGSVIRVLREECELWEKESVTAEMISPVYETAVKETEGQVLTYKGELRLVPYHEISSGKTRSGEEVFHDAAYTYLKSVDSTVDKEAPDYLNSVYIPEYKFPENFFISGTDSAGYVTSVKADDTELEGEAFRRGMGLCSSCFSVQKVGENYRFLCKGKGHGLGFSQYGGNALAKEGYAAQEILQTYFPEMDLDDVDDFLRKTE